MKKLLLITVIAFNIILAGCNENETIPSVPTQSSLPAIMTPNSTPLPNKQPQTLPADNEVNNLDLEAPQTLLPISEANISDSVKVLCETPRKYGTEGEAQACAYIKSQMQSYGYDVTVQEFPVYKETMEYFFSDSFFNMNPLQSEELGYGQNIIVSKPTTQSTEKTIVISAHYDSIGDCVSAIDNASGAAAVMEAARVLQNYDLPLNVNFIFFSAEEYYLTGSRNYMLQLTANERANLLGCINVDMVGESGGGSLELRTAEGHNILTLLYKSLLPEKETNIGVGGSSDDLPFTRMNIPAFSIAQSNPNYELQKKTSDLEDFEPRGCVDATQIIVDFMTSYDISAHEALLIERPVEEVDVSYFNEPLFIFKFSKGALPKYNLTESYSKLLENGVTGEYVCMFENNQGKSYSISQIMCAAPQIDLSSYKKVVLNEWTFGTYYIDSDETKTTLVCVNGSFLLKIAGQISEAEAVSVFFNMRKE